MSVRFSQAELTKHFLTTTIGLVWILQSCKLPMKPFIEVRVSLIFVPPIKSQAYEWGEVTEVTEMI